MNCAMGDQAPWSVAVEVLCLWGSCVPGASPDTLFTLSRWLCVALLSPQGLGVALAGAVCSSVFHMENLRTSHFFLPSHRVCLPKTRVELMEEPQEGSSDYCRSQHRGCCR